MGFFKKTIFMLSAGCIIAGIAGWYGNKYAILGTDDSSYSNNIQVSLPEKTTINKDTVIEFQYNYSDGLSSTQCTLPAQYMTDYDKKQLQQAYSSWQMESFSPSKVVFVKNFDSESTQHYILKEYNGYVGVFYKKSGMLKELTSTPIASLSTEDAERYKKGINVDGDENLMKCLEGLET